MTVNIDVSAVICFYMTICVALLMFNLAYILRSDGKRRNRQRAEEKWRQELSIRLVRLEHGEEVDPEHLRSIGKKLRSPERLAAYNEAVQRGMAENPELMQRYLDGCITAFQSLALYYSRRPAMERAFYAHAMSEYRPLLRQHGGHLPELLLTYFDGSTVFCRENVLKALCCLGNAAAVEHAFSILSVNEWYHHARLLSDGLMKFAGDRAALARRLWSACGDWAENLQVAVVQFASNVSGEFGEEFLAALRSGNMGTETGFALVRYFRRWPYPPARPLLIELVCAETRDSGGLAIAAAAVLDAYPGQDTVSALFHALHSRNWYVRRNAASSLAALGAASEKLPELRSGGDRYAAEMLEYMLGPRSDDAETAKEAVTV